MVAEGRQRMGVVVASVGIGSQTVERSVVRTVARIAGRTVVVAEGSQRMGPVVGSQMTVVVGCRIVVGHIVVAVEVGWFVLTAYRWSAIEHCEQKNK